MGGTAPPSTDLRFGLSPRRDFSHPHKHDKQLYSRFCFVRHLSRRACGAPVAAAVGEVDRAWRCHCDGSRPGSLGRRVQPHPPCSRLDIRLAGRIAATAGGLLHHHFHPSPPRPFPARRLVEFAVAVVVTGRLPNRCPHLLFREATLPGPTLPATFAALACRVETRGRQENLKGNHIRRGA